MSAVVRDPAVDGTLGLLREGYEFISNRCARLQSDAFETRLLGAKTICLRGAEPARMFYDPTLMQREGAMPSAVQKTLLGSGGVQGLDGEAHRHRKAMFMSLMTRERIAALADTTAVEWRHAADRWPRSRQIVLFDQAQQILCRAVCAWSGVPLPDEDVQRRTADFDAMIGGAAALGPRHWQSRRARRRVEHWIAELVEQTRAGRLPVDGDAALAEIAAHRDLNGQLLPARVAAVEVLNVLRPTVAIATYVTFAALALHEYAAANTAVSSGEPGLDSFVHEVRRFYPFFPFAAARVRQAFEWRGHPFPEGRRVLFDLYGTNHDSRIWETPETFRPARFAGAPPDAYHLVPQGGGEHDVHHRCAGEAITIELTKTAVRFLSRGLEYRVPRQDLSVSLRTIPTLPRSRFVIELPSSRESEGRA